MEGVMMLGIVLVLFFGYCFLGVGGWFKYLVMLLLFWFVIVVFVLLILVFMVLFLLLIVFVDCIVIFLSDVFFMVVFMICVMGFVMVDMVNYWLLFGYVLVFIGVNIGVFGVLIFVLLMGMFIFK